MRVHRSAHPRTFTVLPNGLLQDRRLSYTARGLLADLLSRPDGRREDGRQMADTSPQGRGAIRRALKELTSAGYYRVDLLRMPDGTIRSEAHVYDTPQLTPPGVPRPASGEATTGPADTPLVKNQAQEPTLPADPPDEPSAAPDNQTTEAVATLFRAIRPDPRLRLGEREALALAPLVARWLERGSTVTDLSRALLTGLPTVVRSPIGILRSRLERKLPPAQPPAARPVECTKCHDPVPAPGICRPCAGISPRAVDVGRGAAATRTGAALARDAMRTAKAAMHLGTPAPAS